MSLSRKDVELLVECHTKINYLEEDVKELKLELADIRKEKTHEKERISDKRLAIYLASATIVSAFVTGIVILVMQWALGL
jgi:F0F1-type ATP synthase assembly protein I